MYRPDVVEQELEETKERLLKMTVLWADTSDELKKQGPIQKDLEDKLAIMEELVGKNTLLDIYKRWERAEDNFEESLYDVVGGYKNTKWSYDKFWIDPYDSSCEFSQVPNDYFLTVEQQKLMKEAGFGTCFINHKNGWESHYGLGGNLPFTKPWRVRYGHKVKKQVKGGMEVIGIPGEDKNEQCQVVTFEDSLKDD